MCPALFPPEHLIDIVASLDKKSRSRLEHDIKREEHRIKKEEEKLNKNKGNDNKSSKKIKNKDGLEMTKGGGIEKSDIIKYLKIAVGVVAILALLIVLKMAFGKKNNDNFYSILNDSMSIGQGEFDYIIDVRSTPSDGSETSSLAEPSESGEETQEALDKAVSEGELNGEESTDEQSDETQSEDFNNEDTTVIEEDEDTGSDRKTLSAQTQEWDANEIDNYDFWKYPNYQVHITGGVNNQEGQPLDAKATIEISTEHYNGKFTDIIMKEDKYYIDLQQMRNWLLSSKERYFVELGNKIPQSSTYIVSDRNNLQFRSNYAEDGETNASILGIDYAYRDLLSNLQFLSSTLQNSLGNRGLYEKDKNFGITLESEEDSQALYNALSGFVNNWGSVFDSKVAKWETDGIYDKLQAEQAKNERDNVLDAIKDVYVAFQTNNAQMMHPTIKGNAMRSTLTGDANYIQSQTDVAYTLNNVNYNITFSFNRTIRPSDVVIPTEAVTDISEFDNPLVVDEIFDDVLNYLNFTDVKLSNTLEKTPAIIRTDALGELADYINSLNMYEYKLTKDNIQSFIDLYSEGSKKSKDPNADTYAKIISDFNMEMKTLGKKTIDEQVKQKEEKGGDEDVERFPSAKKKFGDTIIIAKIDEKNSKHNILELTIKVRNNKNDSVKIDAKDFRLKTLLNSEYAPNSKTLLKNKDSKILDKITLEDTLKVNPKSNGKFKIYYAIEALEHTELFYKDKKVGVVIQY